MYFYAMLAIAGGAVLGAWARWGLALWLNAVSSNVPLGTLLANLLGGYLVGLALAFFTQQASIAPEWRLFIVTGFLGSLTTFSTFSAEAVSLLTREQYLTAILMISLHLFGSLLMTVLGMHTFKWLFS